MKPIVSIFVLLLLLATGCTKSLRTEEPSRGTFDGEYILNLKIGKDLNLPVNVTISGEEIIVKNGEEEIRAKNVVFKGGSLTFKMPAFRNEFIFQESDTGFTGQWNNYAKGPDYSIPAELVRGTKRFLGSSDLDVSGNWQAVFSKGTEDEYTAKGVFEQSGSKVTGTFRTTTGDYRFLQGVIDGDELSLSCFDGAHAFLFVANLKEQTLDGVFYSGKHWKGPWMATKVDDYELPDPDTLTFIKEDEKFDFSFPNTAGETVSFKDFSGKPVIVQITGTWCPNCMDETVLLNQMYDKYHEKGLEIVALAFEPADDFEEAVEFIDNFVNDMGVKYPVLHAGSSDKGEAIKSLPMLNHIMSYPTTLFFDKTGNLLKIHTGFNGPSTGQVYTDFVAEITNLIENKML